MFGPATTHDPQAGHDAAGSGDTPGHVELDAVEPDLDPLTGLRSRQRFFADLALVVEQASPTALVLFEFGGPGLFDASASLVESEALLRMLSGQLDQGLGPTIPCYRSREAELAALIPRPQDAAARLVAATCKFLCKHDSELELSVAFGLVMIPAEASDVVGALKLADRRLVYNARTNGY